jgi:hypothetical protein
MSAEIETIHKPFIDWLDTQPVCYAYTRSDKPTTARWPEADFIVFRAGACIHLEAKDKHTAISASQQKRHAMLAAVGTRVFIFRSCAYGIELVTAWLTMLGEAGKPRPIASGRCYIKATREHGSAIFDATGKFLRKATIQDLGTYQHK